MKSAFENMYQTSIKGFKAYTDYNDVKEALDFGHPVGLMRFRTSEKIIGLHATYNSPTHGERYDWPICFLEIAKGYEKETYVEGWPMMDFIWWIIGLEAVYYVRNEPEKDLKDFFEDLKRHCSLSLGGTRFGGGPYTLRIEDGADMKDVCKAMRKMGWFAFHSDPLTWLCKPTQVSVKIRKMVRSWPGTSDQLEEFLISNGHSPQHYV